MNELKEIKRNNFGLIEGLEYKFTEDGAIDWKSMVDPKFIYVNPSNKEKMAKKYKKPYEEIKPFEDKVEDIDLVIMLGGIKQIMRLRGFNSVKYQIKEANENYAAVNCIIKFIPNYESSMQEVEFSDNACASPSNTTGFGQRYLLEMATNRSLCRATRSFLGLNIVSKEELNTGIEDEPKSSAPDKSINLLQDLMDKKHVNWAHIANTLKRDDEKSKLELKDGQTFIPKWNENYKSIQDLPKPVIFDLLDRLKKLKID